MSGKYRSVFVILSLCVLSLLNPVTASAQRRRPHSAVRGGVVFVGGYFYDPQFGPYPWWPPMAYPGQYYPMFDNRAELRVIVTPREAAVYVDGFYAGVADDFDGFFQRLPLTPGGHEIVLYLEGFRTEHRNVYLMPDTTFKLEFAMERLPVGARSEPPLVAPPVPMPPTGTFAQPRTPPIVQPAAPGAAAAAAIGTIVLRVQPSRADVTIDGQRWTSSDGEHFVVDVPPGQHRIEVSKPGRQPFSVEIAVIDGETTPLNVSLPAE